MNELGYMKHSLERRALFDRTYIQMAETFAELSMQKERKLVLLSYQRMTKLFLRALMVRYQVS